MRKAGYLAILLVVVAVGGWRVLAMRGGAGGGQERVPTAEVRRGALVVTLPVSGALESAEETPVRAEIAGVLIQICQDNTPVKVEDFVFQLDTKALGDQREELVGALADAQEGLNSTKAEGETQIAQAESDAAAARESLLLAQEKAQAENEKMAAQVKYAEGETARAERELARAQRLAQLNYIAGTKLREEEKAYRRQQFALDQQRAQQTDTEKRTAEQVQDQETALALAEHGLDTAKADAAAEAEDARIRVAEAGRRLAEVEKKIGQCMVTAPAAGLAVIETNSENWPERRPYRLGDQVQSGASPVRIYNTGKMQVRCQIGEMDISRVRAGQEAYVTTPGQAGRRYRARVALVEELAQESNVWQGGTPGKKVFGVLVTLSEADPLRLRPGMTVDLEIVLNEVREATTVPIRAVFTEDHRSYVYRVKPGVKPDATGPDLTFERVEVTMGTRNDLLAEVRSGLEVGDRVALEIPLHRVVDGGHPSTPLRASRVNSAPALQGKAKGER